MPPKFVLCHVKGMAGLIGNTHSCMMVKVKTFASRTTGHGTSYYRIRVSVVYWFRNRHFVFKSKNGLIIIRNWGNQNWQECKKQEKIANIRCHDFPAILSKYNNLSTCILIEPQHSFFHYEICLLSYITCHSKMQTKYQ